MAVTDSICSRGMQIIEEEMDEGRYEVTAIGSDGTGVRLTLVQSAAPSSIICDVVPLADHDGDTIHMPADMFECDISHLGEELDGVLDSSATMSGSLRDLMVAIPEVARDAGLTGSITINKPKGTVDELVIPFEVTHQRGDRVILTEIDLAIWKTGFLVRSKAYLSGFKNLPPLYDHSGGRGTSVTAVLREVIDTISRGETLASDSNFQVTSNTLPDDSVYLKILRDPGSMGSNVLAFPIKFTAFGRTP